MARRASLDKQRKAIVEQIGELEQQGLHPSDSFVALSVLTEQAHNITAKDFQAYCAVISGLYKGVSKKNQLQSTVGKCCRISLNFVQRDKVCNAQTCDLCYKPGFYNKTASTEASLLLTSVCLHDTGTVNPTVSWSHGPHLSFSTHLGQDAGCYCSSQWRT